MSYPIENLFRKPVELIPATTSITTCAALWMHSDLFMVTPAINGLASIGLILHAAWRGRQGMQIVRFQKNLKRLPLYVMTSDEIPWSAKELFLGMGFRWDQRHTQRLYQARHPSNANLRARNDLYEWAREFERNHPDSPLTAFLRKDSLFNPVPPLPPVGGDPAIHGIEPKERPIWMDILERVGHLLVLGTTRVGKTRLAELLITQDIHRGDVVIVFDPKGDVALLKRMYAEAKRAGREEQFYMFHLGYPDISARYNPVGTFSKITEVATRTANQLPGEGQSAAFKEFVWRFVNVMARAMTALGMKPSYEAIYQNAVNIDDLCIKYFQFWLDRDHPAWKDELLEVVDEDQKKQIAAQAKKTGRSIYALEVLALIREKGWHDPIADGLSSVLANDRSYFEKLVSSLYPLLEKLTTGKVSELLSPNYDDPNDPRPIFDWNKIIDQGGIVYVGLDSLSDFEVAGAVGNAMFADLTSTAGRRYKYGSAFGQSGPGGDRKISIHGDEFNELIGDEFVPLLNKAGGAGYQVTVYTQTWSDVEAKIGSAAKAGQIGGNLNTLIMLRVKNTETAEILTDQLPKVEIYSNTLVSSASDANDPHDFADFSANAQDRISTREVPMIQPADLVQLPKGQAFALIEGGQLVKIRMPLASDENDVMMPANLQAMCADMERKYQAYIASVENNAGGTFLAGRHFPEGVDPYAIQVQTGASGAVTVEGTGSGF